MNTLTNFSNIEKLNCFLKNHYITKDSNLEPTHTELNPGENRGRWGRYKILDNELDKFLELYHNALNDGNKLTLVERPRELSPLKIDFDFRFDKHNDEHLYDNNDLQNIVKAYLTEINKFYNVEDSNKTAFIYEIPSPVTEIKEKENRSNYTYKDGIHIMFPYIVTKPSIQHIIRNNIISKFNDIIDNNKISFINNVNDIVDKSIIDSSGWMMYGSSKSHDRIPYKLTKVFKYHTNILDDDIIIEEDDINKYTLKDIIYLSSIQNKNIESPLIDTKIDEIKNYEDKKKHKDITKNIKKYKKNDNDPNIIKNYLDMLLPERRDNYNSWMEVGLALYNIGDGSEDYLELWDNFSKESDKYENNCCKNKWKGFREKDNGLSIGSIRYWARMDNRNEYIRYTYKLGFFNNKINECLEDGDDFDIAQVVIALYKDQFIYDDNESVWYEFVNHKWKKGKKEPHTLLKYLSTDVVSLLTKSFTDSYLPDWQSKNFEEDRINSAKNARKILRDIKKKCKNNSHKKSILNECKAGFIDDDFIKNLDLNKNLICFNNGVYDLENKYFRNGRPSDCISMTTNNDYIHYDENNQETKEIIKFIDSVQPSQKDILDYMKEKKMPSDRIKEFTKIMEKTQGDCFKERQDYLKSFLASILQGNNTDESFHIFTGEGRNGKSKLIELVQTCFGDYSGCLNMSGLTQSRKSSSEATPELYSIITKRFVTLNEASKGEKINNGILKEYSGGDKVTCRGLFKDPVVLKPMYKLALICNTIPPLQDSSDNATYERLRVIEFVMHFVDEPTDIYERITDPTVTTRIEQWKKYLMGILIHWYHIYFPDNVVKLKPPKIVKKYTNEYRNNIDIWSEFYTNTYILKKTKDLKDVVNIRTLVFKEFKDWCSDTEIHKPTWKDFKVDFQKRFKIQTDDIVNNKIKGWKFEKFEE